MQIITKKQQKVVEQLTRNYVKPNNHGAILIEMAAKKILENPMTLDEVVREISKGIFGISIMNENETKALELMSASIKKEYYKGAKRETVTKVLNEITQRAMIFILIDESGARTDSRKKYIISELTLRKMEIRKGELLENFSNFLYWSAGHWGYNSMEEFINDFVDVIPNLTKQNFKKQFVLYIKGLIYGMENFYNEPQIITML